MSLIWRLEHMEKDELNERGLPEWVELEYMVRLVGNRRWFESNVSLST
jgi:hypothetical protein